jgi:hypothetical protein
VKFVPCSARCLVIGVMLSTLLAAHPTAAQDTRDAARRGAERRDESERASARRAERRSAERRDERERASARRAERRARAQRDVESRGSARERRDQAQEQREQVQERREQARERQKERQRARDAARTQARDESDTKPARPTKKRDAERPRAVRAESVVAAPTPSEDDASDIVREGDTSVKVMRFSGLDIEGRLKSPQLMVFVERVRAEFERPRLPHRSFIPEIGDAASQLRSRAATARETESIDGAREPVR